MSIQVVKYLAFVVYLPLIAKAQTANKADTIVQENLNIIGKFVNAQDPRTTTKVASAVSFLESLTGITSVSDGDFGGKNSPTKRDLDIWSEWYFFNKKDLMWDEKSKSVILHKVVKPPIE
jgi:hypothetical protein